MLTKRETIKKLKPFFIFISTTQQANHLANNHGIY